MKISRLHLALSLPVVILVSAIAPAQTKSSSRSSTRNVTGHYRLTKDEFRNRLDVQQLDPSSIKFYLLALWVSYNNPDNIHNGELHGTAKLQNGIAFYQASECRIRMEFSAKQARLTELEVEGCGFGANVTAAGTYRKLDSKRPKFDF